MGALIVEEVDSETYSYALKNKEIPLWGNAKNLAFYEDALYLIAKKGQDIEAVWAVPIMLGDNGERIARRSWRLMPYAAPIFFNATGLARRAAVEGLFLFLCQRVNAIALPLSPECVDISILQNHGALIEWRHTHVLDSLWQQQPLPPKISNHLKYAGRHLDIRKSTDPNGFLFEHAISNENAKGLQNRSDFARNLLHSGQGYYLSAFHNNEIVGQSYIVIDDKNHYILHTWSKKGGVRGVPTALIKAAAEACLSRGTDYILDLEGSVLPGVDEFFYGFQGRVVIYGYLLWRYDKAILSKALINEIMPTERCALKKESISGE